MGKRVIAIATTAMLGGGIFLTSGPNAAAEEVALYKNPQCSCCESYATYLRANGFVVTVKPTHDLLAMSHEAGIPKDFEGCHLAFIDDYVVSGHVPVGSINKLLTERPDIKGITLPGMPMGSPGMSGAKTEPFTIYTVGDEPPEVYTID